MGSIGQLCKPRQGIFDTQRRDTVLDLTDLIEDKIQPSQFFEENFVTEGMKTLLEQSFRRLEGKSTQGIFKLKQAMGGGKTHNLLTLGLLARYPKFREQVMGKFYNPEPSLGSVKVIAFSGRESDIPWGLWGAIAEQMGKHEQFKDLYSPLRAPGQTAWETLLGGETALILLDELPPYFDNARSIPIGDSNLARVTATALSNLLIAIGREPCSRVCLVITDLVGSYETGSEQISEILSNLEKETHRTAMSLEPVRMNSDELYHILRKRIFEETPGETAITEVAQAYAKAIRDAKQMDITNESPEQFASRIQVSYPFHPAIRDLYARFKENPGFQQTRGLIRLMRIVVSRLWETGLADKRLLISAHDLDFNDRETRAEIGQINNTLDNAIAHDIASDGTAVAEVMDVNLGGSDAQDASRLLLMASLANVPNAVMGLSIPELVTYLAEPSRDLAALRTMILEKLATAAWYLHSTRDGKLFFKNVQNLNAKLESLVKAYQKEQAERELRNRLESLFEPINGYCYQKVLALPAIDEIELEQDRITLVISEPFSGSSLRQEIRDFYEQTTWQNRVAFLTGSRNTYEQLIETGKRLKAIQSILEDLVTENVPDNDPQIIQARDLADRIQQNFYSAVRETFTVLWFPLPQGLTNADLSMRFDGNRYHGEEQIQNLLEGKKKFETTVTGEMFQKKCEQRLFSTQSLPWNEIKRRAATNTQWQWHHPKALEELKLDCIRKDIWREEGGYVDRGPFPQPKSSVLVNEKSRNDETGEVILQITPVHADVVYYDIGAEATTASAKLDEFTLTTKDLRVSFMGVDSTNLHETGESVTWTNRITLKHRIFQSGENKKMELRAAPDAKIYYTTDGSDPKNAGATYDEPLIIPYKAPFVLAYAERDAVSSNVERFPLQWDREDTFRIDPGRQAVWERGAGYNSTKETYEVLGHARKYQANLSGVTITISGIGSDKSWVELSMFPEKEVSPEVLEECLDVLRKVQTTGQVSIRYDALHFQLGQDLLDWVEDTRTTLKPGEVIQ